MRALLLAVVAATAASAQPLDSLARAPVAVDTTEARTPRGAVTRALLLPGLGQVYNRQPVKAPVAAALVAGAAVYFADRQRQYVLYRRASVVAGCLQDGGDPDTSPDRVDLCTDAVDQYQDEYDRISEGQVSPPTFATVRAVRDQARGQRDIGGVVVLAAYALQALDAFVSAELADFDVSEDLSLSILPGPASPRLSLRVGL